MLRSEATLLLLPLKLLRSIIPLLWFILEWWCGRWVPFGHSRSDRVDRLQSQVLIADLLSDRCTLLRSLSLYSTHCYYTGWCATVDDIKYQAVGIVLYYKKTTSNHRLIQFRNKINYLDEKPNDSILHIAIFLK